MDLALNIWDIVINLDKYLNDFVKQFGVWTYLLLFLILFSETGLVITPFLPGDSLIFVIGALSASGSLKVSAVFITLIAAAIIGDTVNYHVGRFIGIGVMKKEKVWFLKKEYLIRTHQFYEKHGGKTIIIARFVPIIRTFAPFVAGMGEMKYWRFISFNIIGAFLWISIFIAGGYFFGNIPAVKENFTLVIMAIIGISLMPGLIAYINGRRGTPKG